MISDKKLDEANKLINHEAGTQRISIHCGFCNKDHNKRNPPCKQFKDLIAKMTERQKTMEKDDEK